MPADSPRARLASLREAMRAHSAIAERLSLERWQLLRQRRLALDRLEDLGEALRNLARAHQLLADAPARTASLPAASAAVIIG
eukprot:7336917-Alexandrium_andersonii.AAC.1